MAENISGLAVDFDPISSDMLSVKKVARQVIDQVDAALLEDKQMPSKYRKLFDLMLSVLRMVVGSVAANSSNSSLPPSQDPNRKKRGRSEGKGDKRSPGGQPNRKGAFLTLEEHPDEVHVIKIDRRTLPAGAYEAQPPVKHQVVELEIRKKVIEYQAEVVSDAAGNVFEAPFPDGLSAPVQYGSTVKVHAVYMSQFQLLPYERLAQHFRDNCDIRLSHGSIFNFNKQAHDQLEAVEAAIKTKLSQEPVVNADETGINIKGKLAWLHVVSSPKFVMFFPHARRGKEAMDAMDILPDYEGVVCHDHWNAYFRFKFSHALCNAHHLRELTAAVETDGHKWPEKMRLLLLEMNDAIKSDGGSLDAATAEKWVLKYRRIIAGGERECPEPKERRVGATRGRIAKTKSRNLLERLKRFEAETLRFLTEPLVPFTNNRGENDIRMTKVKAKISGCFRTIENAKIFCRIRGYLLTCQRLLISPTDALEALFRGKLPPELEEALRPGAE